jgi:hypothetical protein
MRMLMRSLVGGGGGGGGVVVWWWVWWWCCGGGGGWQGVRAVVLWSVGTTVLTNVIITVTVIISLHTRSWTW